MATAETGRGALRTCGVAAVDEGAAFDRADKVLGAVVVNGVNQVVVEGAALYHADGHFAVPCRHSAAHALHLSGWSRGRGRRRRGVCVGCAAAAGGLAFALPPRGPAEAQHGSHGGEPQQTDHGAAPASGVQPVSSTAVAQPRARLQLGESTYGTLGKNQLVAAAGAAVNAGSRCCAG
jgi:hypothetical protein